MSLGRFITYLGFKTNNFTKLETEMRFLNVIA